MDLQKGKESKRARVEEYDSYPSFVYIYYMHLLITYIICMGQNVFGYSEGVNFV